MCKIWPCKPALEGCCCLDIGTFLDLEPRLHGMIGIQCAKSKCSDSWVCHSHTVLKTSVFKLEDLHRLPRDRAFYKTSPCDRNLQDNKEKGEGEDQFCVVPNDHILLLPLSTGVWIELQHEVIVRSKAAPV